MKPSVSLILAAIFPLVLFSWFVPTPYNQLDFLLLWLGAMLLLALPTVYAEIALANRSGTSPMNGIQKLTREADASTLWRGIIWGGMLSSMLVALSLINVSSTLLYPILTDTVGMNLQSFVLPFILVVAVTIASVWGIKTAIVGLLLIIISFALKVSGNSTLALTMTEINLQEWSRASVLALVSVGGGSGLYWFTNNLGRNALTDPAHIDKTVTKANKLIASRSVLPIWGVQLVTGTTALLLLALTGGTGSESVMANTIKAMGLLCLSAVLLHFICQLLKDKFASGRIGSAKAFLLTLVLGLTVTSIFTLLPMAVMQSAVVVVSLLSALMLSLFTGWQMKISHLRKSMNFSSEGLYNIWRVAIRLVVPLSIALSLIGWIQIWLAGAI